MPPRGTGDGPRRTYVGLKMHLYTPDSVSDYGFSSAQDIVWGIAFDPVALATKFVNDKMEKASN